MVNVSEIDENYIIKNSHDLSSESKLTKLINDVSQATKVETVTGEAIILAAGAAGTTGKIRIGYAPIMDSIGGRIGYYRASTDKDSSLVLSSTALATGQMPLVDGATETGIYSALTNGTYSVDYVNGIIYYKKGTTGTTGTVNYKYTGQEVDLSVNSLSIGDVTSNSQNIATEATLSNADSTLTTIAGLDFATETTLTSIDGKDFATEATLETIKDKLADIEILDANAAKSGSTKVVVTQNIDSSGNIGGGSSPSTTADYKSPSDFNAVYTSNVTITLSGVPITITDNSQIKYIMMVPAAGQAKIFVNGSGGVTITHAANVLTITGAGTPFTAGDVYEVGINGSTKAYDTSTDTTKIINITPESSKYVPDAIVNTTNLAATTHYFPSSTGMEMGGFNHLSIGGELIDADGNITLSVEVANNSDASTAVWHQIYGYDMINNTTVNQQAVASGTTSYFMDFEALNVTHVRFKVICSGATNTVKVMARRKV